MHIQKKLALLPVIRGENDVQGLRLLHDQIERSMRDLRSLDVGISTYGALLVALVTEKLPNNLRLLMVRKLRTEKWDIKEMLEILEEGLEAKERSIAFGSSFDDTFEKNHSTSAFNKTGKNLLKNHVFLVTRTIIFQVDAWKYQNLHPENYLSKTINHVFYA